MILAVSVGEIIPTNAYFYIDDTTSKCLLVDPGGNAEKLLAVIDERKLAVEKILLTHGHFDHMGAAQTLQDHLDVPIVMHENGRAYATNAEWNLSAVYGMELTLENVTYLPDNSKITLAANPAFGVTLRHVPGHTTDGAIYVCADNRAAFVGDCIFKNSYGNTSFFGGDEKTLLTNIKRRILTLPDETVLLSGHSEPTTVGAEKNRPWYAFAD